MQAFGEFDQHHAQILGDGEQQLAQTFGMGLLFVAFIGLVGKILGHRHSVHAIDETRDAGTEFFTDAVDVGIVAAGAQDRGRQGFVIEVQCLEYLRDAERVCQGVRLRPRTEGQCLTQQREFFGATTLRQWRQPGIELGVADGWMIVWGVGLGHSCVIGRRESAGLGAEPLQ